MIPFGFIFMLYLLNYSLTLDTVLYTHIQSGIIHLFEEYMIKSVNLIPFGFIFLLYLFNNSLALDIVLYTHIRSSIIHLLEEYTINIS